MKKHFLDKVLAVFLTFTSILICLYLYKKGKITFLPKTNKSSSSSQTVEIPFTEKEFNIKYQGNSQKSALTIASFEKTEKWQGDGEYDFTNYFEGNSSLALNTQNHSKSIAILDLKNKVQLNNYSLIKLFLSSQTKVEDIETLNIIMSSSLNGKSYLKEIKDIKKGWQLYIIPTDDFKENTNQPTVSNSVKADISKSPDDLSGREVDRVTIELVSKPKTAASINIDYLWTETDESYLDNWKTTNSKIFLKENSSATHLAITYFGDNFLLIKKITSAKDYNISTKFIPQDTGKFGFFLRGYSDSGNGYYLVFNGTGLGSWQINKIGTFGKEKTIVLSQGEVSNFKIEKNKEYWLKGELKGPSISFYLSLNGVDYTLLGEVKDSSYPAGGVGITSNNQILLVDDIKFVQ